MFVSLRVLHYCLPTVGMLASRDCFSVRSIKAYGLSDERTAFGRLFESVDVPNCLCRSGIRASCRVPVSWFLRNADACAASACFTALSASELKLLIAIALAARVANVSVTPVCSRKNFPYLQAVLNCIA